MRRLSQLSPSVFRVHVPVSVPEELLQLPELHVNVVSLRLRVPVSSQMLE